MSTVEVKVEKEFQFAVSNQDREIYAKKYQELREMSVKVRAELKEFAEQAKEKLIGYEDTMKKLDEAVKTGVETRTVECSMVKDFSTNSVRFVFHGETMEERAMTQEERQADEQMEIITPAPGLTLDQPESVAQAV